MKLQVKPSSVSGALTAPPSKSCTHRAIILAALAKGTSKINGALLSRDTRATMQAMEAFGATVKEENGVLTIRGGRLKAPMTAIDCMNSGTTLRLCCGVASLLDKNVTFTGDESLKGRPMKPLFSAFAEMGVYCAATPQGFIIRGPNNGRWAHIKGDISSQFISSLLISSALKPRDTDIVLTSPLISKPYIAITQTMMAQFGVKCNEMKDGYRVMGGQSYRPRDYTVPGDYSSAAFALGAAALAGKVTISGLDPQDVQGDRAIISFLQEFGAEVTINGNEVIVQQSELKGIKADIGDCPDLFPILAVIATQAEGETVLYNAAHLKHKESDRIAAVVTFLKNMGAEIEEKDDGCLIKGKCKLTGCTINPSGDHRILMAAAVAALVAEGKTIINDGDCYDVSYPAFLKDFKDIGADVEEVE
ncbi:3-phosphoshikimate 1-carboxyvinyltransferase [Candidatus Methanomassiliicoccus intestinalis]|uniref:3-phosphoshikimate 1-carboxyvinyltransferase n=1 Tax=Candidatus Methanomassiliicoccus intestinalis TaxID=1406512 RepID=UPI0037DC63EF